MMPRSEAAIPRCPKCGGQMLRDYPFNPLPRTCLQCGKAEEKPITPLPLVHGSLWKRARRERRAG